MTHSKMNTRDSTDLDEPSSGGAVTRDSIQMTLARDHERLERLVRSTIYAMDSTDPAELRSSWLAFECELERHLDAEEKHVLPAFARSRPGEARALKAEHQQIRAWLMDIGVDLDLHCLGRERLSVFADALRAHARREDALFYPWASRYQDIDVAASVTEAVAPGKELAGETKRWWIDADGSSLEFSLRHIVVGQIRGRFTRWGGTVKLDVADVEKSGVRVWVDLSSVETGDPERDEQVRSSEFFDIARFGPAVFTSTRVELADGIHPVIVGILELHGVKAEVTIEITEDLPWQSDPRALKIAFPIRARFDRRDFGLRWNQDLDVGGIVVGDEVELTARVHLVRGSAGRSTYRKS